MCSARSFVSFLPDLTLGVIPYSCLQTPDPSFLLNTRSWDLLCSGPFKWRVAFVEAPLTGYGGSEDGLKERI